ncbi:MAG: hypothetical protein LBQ98_07745 [Nitrososphaerota archaeon]|jgi:hypothetical protein|nr:hypothetical protein [Nitrososphaerota archaeon]
MIIEALPLPVNDNVLVPVITGVALPANIKSNLTSQKTLLGIENIKFICVCVHMHRHGD